LPPAPPEQTGPVKAWAQPVEILTYAPAAADKNPMFLEKRVYQGSSGRVYPLAFTDRIATKPEMRSWQALHLENEFIRLMILPELGGRIHVGVDKTNGYDFFYRQNVIKPALVGLAGPWISGGVEFNWPQHHRPATFMPLEWAIEELADGGRIIWCSDHDPMSRMKGMHGICLRPGRALVEIKARLYNRTPLTQTFLWWVNAGVHVHESYQSFFPPDVHFVADHAKRAVSTFPLCDGVYYGVDYRERARNGWKSSGPYAPNDLSWYANIPVPTSYMAIGSNGDFFGGYDHRKQAGVVHWANHHIAPGKKQWTWGNHEFGYAWDRNLTDEDGPYIELMAGVYTDNQPDFSFLAPGETKTFSQFWYPIQKIGPVQEANTEAALSFRLRGERAEIGVCATRRFEGVRVELSRRGEVVSEWKQDLAPGRPFLEEAAVPPDANKSEFEVRVFAGDERELIRYAPKQPEGAVVPPAPAVAPQLPPDVASNDELYLTGLHLEQYRHPTRAPEDYWLEAVRRDPGDARCCHALGLWHLRRGEFEVAIEWFRRSIARLTFRNPNPYDGEPYYSLGVALRFARREDEAYDAFYKAVWNFAWRSPGYYALAEIDVARGEFDTALEHLNLCLSTNADHSNARNLKVMVLRKLGRASEAEELLTQTLAADPLDVWARYLAKRPIADNGARLDVAFDLMRAGLAEEGRELMEVAKAEPDFCFPSRLEELQALEAAVAADPNDARAHFDLGNWLYDRRRHEEAIAHWERAVDLDGHNSVVWRNLGIAYFNVRGDGDAARAAYRRAIRVQPSDARLYYEQDQLWKRTGVAVATRLAELEANLAIVQKRDDLTIELAALCNQTGQPERAAVLLASRRFQPWEGGEGAVLGQYVRTQVLLALQPLEAGEAGRARTLLHSALHPPEHLGEAWHLLANRSRVYYWLGVACDADGDAAAARDWWTKAAESLGDFQEMAVRAYSEMSYYSALALQRLGRKREATKLLRAILQYARTLARTPAQIDYFATSLPAMLVFNDDLQKRQSITALVLEAQATLGLGYPKRGQRLLNKVLKGDPSHPIAFDVLAELRTAAKLASELYAGRHS